MSESVWSIERKYITYIMLDETVIEYKVGRYLYLVRSTLQILFVLATSYTVNK